MSKDRAIKVGDKVRMSNEEAHTVDPENYPPIGTVGTVIKACNNIGVIFVQWQKGTTSYDDCHWCAIDEVEVIEND